MPERRVTEPPLAYERSPSHYATRGQFRLLMALVLLNLLITLQFAYFPSLTASIKQRWTQYQQKREREAAVKQALAVEQQAINFFEPPGKVVWDENPDTAAGLLAGQGYKRIQVGRLLYIPPLARWPHGAAAETPPVIQAVFPDQPFFPGLRHHRVVAGDEFAVALLHGLKSPSGQERLVYVYVQGKLDLTNSSARSVLEAPPTESDRARADTPGTFTVTKELRVVAVPCLPGAGQKPPAPLPADETTLLIHGEGTTGLPLKWHWTPPADNKPEQIQLEGREMFRFYAGQPDPSDASRFTIDYDVDGQRGTIRGQLKNDGKIELKPTTGTTVGTRWHPTRPATGPAGQ